MQTDTRLIKEFAERIGISISIARREQGRTMAELAARLDMSRTTLHKIESGDPSVRLAAVLAAAIATRVDVPELINLRPEQIAARDKEQARLALLLPERVRAETIDDDF